MELIQAIVYGVIQGITEWLPISSTAHLRIVPSLLQWGDPGATFTAVIQLGSVFAVLVYFAKDLKQIIQGSFQAIRERKFSSVEAKIGMGAVVGTLPILILGYLFKDYIKGDLRSLYVIAGTLIVGGIMMMVAEAVGKRTRGWEDLTLKDGVVVGLFQALALIPGMSRSGSTISGALFLGLDRETAARYSFILSLPSIVAAGLYELVSEREHVLGQNLGMTSVATILSFVVGLASIHAMLQIIKKFGIAPFVYYRVALGAILLILAFGGYIK